MDVKSVNEKENVKSYFILRDMCLSRPHHFLIHRPIQCRNVFLDDINSQQLSKIIKKNHFFF